MCWGDVGVSLCGVFGGWMDRMRRGMRYVRAIEGKKGGVEGVFVI